MNDLLSDGNSAEPGSAQVNIDQRQFIASLTTGQRKRLSTKSDLHGLAHLAVHFGAIAGLSALIGFRVPFWPVLMLPLGVLIIFLFTALHETIHQTAFKSMWLNNVVARTCGFLIVLPAGWFRFFHFAHHRHTQDPENDPELASNKPETVLQYIIHVSGIPVWIGHFRTIFKNAAGRCDDDFVPVSARGKVQREALGLLACYLLIATVSVITGSPVLLHIWVIPVILGQPFLRLYLLAEHGRCPFVANMFENSRTTFTNFLMRRLAWNMPYHAEHHAVPTIPFYRLPELHVLTRTHLQQTEAGYARFHGKYLRNIGGPYGQPPVSVDKLG